MQAFQTRNTQTKGLGHFSIYLQDYFLKNIVTDLKYGGNVTKAEHNIAGAKLAVPKKKYNNFPPAAGQSPNVVSTRFVLFCGESIFLAHIQPSLHCNSLVVSKRSDFNNI